MKGENGYPETPEWHCEPHACPLPHIVALSGIMPPAVGIATGASALVMPDCVLGDNWA